MTEMIESTSGEAQREIRWVGFAFANSVYSTLIHFFPSSGSVSAPYPASCSLTLFGGGFESKRVTLDGARVSQPDGLRLDDAFPILREGVKGPLGVIVELSTLQPRGDLRGSQCMVEIANHTQSCRFRPQLLAFPVAAKKAHGMSASLKTKIVEAEPVEEIASKIQSTGVLIDDDLTTSSALFVNGTGEAAAPSIICQSILHDGALFEHRTASPTTPASSVVEFPLIPGVSSIETSPIPTRELGYGLGRSAAIVVERPLPAKCALYVLYRDTRTRRLISILPVGEAL